MVMAGEENHGLRLYVCQGFAPQNTNCVYTCVTNTHQPERGQRERGPAQRGPNRTTTTTTNNKQQPTHNKTHTNIINNSHQHQPHTSNFGQKWIGTHTDTHTTDTAGTVFGQSVFGHPYLTIFSQSIFGHRVLGPAHLGQIYFWPIHFWPIHFWPKLVF